MRFHAPGSQPTGPFTNLEPLDQKIGEFYIRTRIADFEAPKLWKGRSGSSDTSDYFDLPLHLCILT